MNHSETQSKIEEKNLNPEQMEAVTTIDGPVLVLAGAGSGKTRIVTRRIAHLIEYGIPPECILGVTFTNKAAGEMRERVQHLTQARVLICTFHSLGVRVLRESISALGYSNSFAIYDEEDAERLLKICLSELNLKDQKIEIKPFRSFISKAKNAMKDPEVDQSPPSFFSTQEDAFEYAYALYQQKLKEYQAVDFDDLLFLTVKLWRDHPEILSMYQECWTHVLIDEYQDTNAAQYTMARLLVEKRKNLFVVGDPDQSIYSWRGADIQNILNFERDYSGAKVIRLEQNYRSCMNILNAANALISHNLGRYEKELWSSLGDGEKIQLFAGENERAEAQYAASRIAYHKSLGVSLNEMVIFYRTNAQSRAFEDTFLQYRIPYVIVGGISFYQRREIKDILAFLRMAQSGADYISFARTINLPKRGFGDATLEKIRFFATQESLTVMGFCETLINENSQKTAIRLNAKQKSGLSDYLNIVHSLHKESKDCSISELVKAAIEKSRYLEYLAEDQETFQDRQENLNELISKAIEWEDSSSDPTLRAFLEELSLKSSLDETGETQDRLSLMTIHNGKGLEFTTAFLAGLEEDLFPHANTKFGEDEKGIEEERRLCYVGITRAKKHLYLSFCRSRFLWGTFRNQKPSRFLKEIPRQYLESASSIRQSIQNPFPATSIEKKKSNSSLNEPVFDSQIFSPGDRIFHQDFGIGQIQDVVESSMGLAYKVLFDKDRMLKTLVAKYAPLKRI